MNLDHTRGVKSTASIMGHPIHPMLIPFPIAFLVGAFAADLAYWLTSDRFWAQAAAWLVGAGLVAGVAAALIGLIDFSTISRARVHRAGWIHALGNSTVLVLALINLLLRLGDPVGAVLPWGLILSGLTAGLLVVTGWYGGELAYKHMIGVTGHGGVNHDAPDMAVMGPSAHVHES